MSLNEKHCYMFKLFNNRSFTIFILLTIYLSRINVFKVILTS